MLLVIYDKHDQENYLAFMSSFDKSNIKALQYYVQGLFSITFFELDFKILIFENMLCNAYNFLELDFNFL